MSLLLEYIEKHPKETKRLKSFLSWSKSISNVTQGEVIAIDGKTLRHSYDRSQEKSAISMVSAWATKNRLVLGLRIGR